MLIQEPSANQIVEKVAHGLRRRVVLNTSLGAVGLGVASLLIFPKVVAFMAGGAVAIGVGLIANLALVFGSLMFLREAQRGRALDRAQPDEAL